MENRGNRQCRSVQRVSTVSIPFYSLFAISSSSSVRFFHALTAACGFSHCRFLISSLSKYTACIFLDTFVLTCLGIMVHYSVLRLNKRLVLSPRFYDIVCRYKRGSFIKLWIPASAGMTDMEPLIHSLIAIVFIRQFTNGSNLLHGLLAIKYRNMENAAKSREHGKSLR
jgi:hypothetical protein